MSYHVYQQYLENYYAAFGKTKHYVVALMSLHSGELTQHEHYCETELAAACLVLGVDFTSMDQVHEYCSNTDCYISVLEINNTLTE